MEKNINQFLNYKLFDIGNTDIKLSSVIFIIVFIFVVSTLLRLIKKFIYRSQKLDESKKNTIFSLTRYIIYVLSFILGMNMIGINVSVLLGASAALLVGIGLGLQSLFSDFVSGIVLLLDSSIKIGDIIEFDKLVCQVKEINLRTTTVLTRDDKYIIVPNSMLTKNSLNNWTHSKKNSRFEIDVRVSYNSDVREVIRILQKVTETDTAVSKNPEPFIRLNDYAESALIFNVYFFTPDVFRVENLKSYLRIKFFEAFKENNIEFPFPQRVIHFDQKEN
jgi:small-conductance mechanosensitive channel